MGRIADEKIDDIRERTDIVEVVSSYLPLSTPVSITRVSVLSTRKRAPRLTSIRPGRSFTVSVAVSVATFSLS